MPTIPNEFRGTKKGDWLTVKDGFTRRSGQSGLVLYVDDEGAGLDFFTCGTCGAKACACYASMEHWNWGELEPIFDESDAVG